MGKMFRCAALFLIVFTALLAGAEVSAYGQTEISRGVANAYYQNCISRDDPRMSDSAQDSLCSCSAAKFMEIMSLEEAVAMNKTPGPGRVEYNKMLTQVYGPCMQAPIEDVLYQECTNDRHVKEFLLRDTARLCRCTAMRSANVIAADGPQMVTRLLKHIPDVTDPMEHMLNDQMFRQKAYANLYECLRDTP